MVLIHMDPYGPNDTDLLGLTVAIAVTTAVLAGQK